MMLLCWLAGACEMPHAGKRSQAVPCKSLVVQQCANSVATCHHMRFKRLAKATASVDDVSCLALQTDERRRPLPSAQPSCSRSCWMLEAAGTSGDLLKHAPVASCVVSDLLQPKLLPAGRSCDSHTLQAGSNAVYLPSGPVSVRSWTAACGTVSFRKASSQE